MFEILRPEDPDLTRAIAKANKELAACPADSKEYAIIIKHLTRLHKLKKKRVDPNTVLIVVGNLAIGLAVLKFETISVVTTRIKTFLMQP